MNVSNGVESNTKNTDKSLKHAVSSDDPQFTITFDYELLDDSYCLLSQGLKRTLLRIICFCYTNMIHAMKFATKLLTKID